MVILHLDRYRVIAETLARHGLGVLLGASGIERFIPFHRSLARYAHRSEKYSTAQHVRLALEELGPTFVKLGQVLSTRSDLLPPAYLNELAKLQDSLSPVPPGVITDVLESELGGTVDDIFDSFDLTPLASASIGQAHAATLADGTEVVVKVRRPGAVEQVEVDLEILQNLAAQADRRWEDAAGYDLPGLAEEFARTLRAELDYLAEGRNAERFAENFADHPGVHIPAIHWETTTSRVLTVERLRGLKVSDLDALDRADVDRPALAARAAEVVAQMSFDDGFFHADPHPGNLFIEADGRIGLIDFGMVGVVDTELRERLGTRLHVAGQVESLPFLSCHFDVVTAAATLHRFAPGLALTEIARVLKPGGRVAVTVPRFGPERVCWALSDAYHANEGGHVRIYRGDVLRDRLSAAGLVPGAQHHAHALHAPFWWLKCAVGVDRDSAAVRAYHRLLVWDLTERPWPTRFAERLLDPVIGKSLVVYARKPPGAVPVHAPELEGTAV